MSYAVAQTITFRPAPGIADALDARRGDEPRSAHINAALTAYLGLTESDDPPEDVRAESCTHPRSQRRRLGYAVRCDACGDILR